MKYIDADKLRKEIEFAKSVYNNPQRVVHGIADAFRQDGRVAMCDDILKKLDSLQQEQPESICSCCIYRNKTDDMCEYPYGGRECFINGNGVYKCNGFEEAEHPEQPEVDLETEIEEYINNFFYTEPSTADFPPEDIAYTMWEEDIRTFARHFYELGLKARKEEEL